MRNISRTDRLPPAPGLADAKPGRRPPASSFADQPWEQGESPGVFHREERVGFLGRPRSDHGNTARARF